MNAATTVDQRVAELRHEGVREALRLVVANDRDAALAALSASVAAQARLLGVRL